MAALDRIEASPIASGPLPFGELRILAHETRALVERMRDSAEDVLFADSDGRRLGFESEKPGYTPPEPRPTEPAAEPEAPKRAPRPHRTAPHRPGLREAVLASDEPTRDLAERLRVSVVNVNRIRREAGDRCAYLSGSGLSKEQRKEIATSGDLVRDLSARHSVAESLVIKLRKTGGVL
jgi:hypothetical protein